MEAETSSDEFFLQIEIFNLAQRIWFSDSVRQTASQFEKVTLLILAMAPRSFTPDLIPFVGVGLQEHARTLHRQAWEEEA